MKKGLAPCLLPCNHSQRKKHSDHQDELSSCFHVLESVLGKKSFKFSVKNVKETVSVLSILTISVC